MPPAGHGSTSLLLPVSSDREHMSVLNSVDSFWNVVISFKQNWIFVVVLFSKSVTAKNNQITSVKKPLKI